jgi:hypothetical protein
MISQQQRISPVFTPALQILQQIKQEKPAAVKQQREHSSKARKTQKLLPMFPAHRKAFTLAS